MQLLRRSKAYAILKKLLNDKSKMKWIAIVFAVMFIISIVPIYMDSFYDHPFGDDYTYGTDTHRTFVESGNVFKAVMTAIDTSVYYYHHWQGTHSAIFLMALQPAIYGEQYYFITTFIVLTALIGGMVFFLYQLLHKLLGLEKSVVAAVAAVILTLSIQLVPRPVAAFYWYNSSIYYIFYYSISLVLFGCIIRMLLAKKTMDKNIICAILVVLGLFLGGGNFVTSLFTLCILFTIMASTYVFSKKNAVQMTIIFLFTLCSSMASYLAPGNATRFAFFSEVQTTVFDTIINSFKYSYGFIRFKSFAIVFAGALLVTILLKDIFLSGRYKFKYPILVLLLTFSLFSVQFAPSYYAMGTSAPPRVRNIIFCSYILIFTFNMVYITGWLYSNITKLIESQYIGTFVEGLNGAINRKIIPAIMVILLVCFITIKAFGISLVSEAALYELMSGQAREYDRQYNERIEVFNSEEEDVVVHGFTTAPFLLFYSDIEYDPEFWANRKTAEYYGKNSITKIE